MAWAINAVGFERQAGRIGNFLLEVNLDKTARKGTGDYGKRLESIGIKEEVGRRLSNGQTYSR